MFWIMVEDCQGYTHQRYPDMPEIEIWFEAKNGGSQFSEEYSGILWINAIMMVSFLYFLGSSAWGYVKEIRLEEKVETPLALLVFAILVEMF